MREHLYRAKRVNWRELPKEEWWVEGFYVQLPKPSLGATIIAGGDLCSEDVADYIIVNKSKQHSNFSNAYPLEVVECEQYEVEPETVCEYTGLTDKNGRKIFEGDIVSYMDTYSTDNGYAESYCIGKVFWCDEELCFHVTERLSAESWEVLEDCYVIGNIFDNSELLEGGDVE